MSMQEGQLILDKVSEILYQHSRDIREEGLQLKSEILQKVAVVLAQHQEDNRHAPTKLESIRQYILLLCEAQRSDHNVHDELKKALEAYRTEAGI